MKTKLHCFFALLAGALLNHPCPASAQSGLYNFTTMAGYAGYGSADGTGSAARFYNPLGVAVDSAGNLYVADSGNCTIRKVTPAGVVTTLAGLAGSYGSADGTGSAARFNFPSGVAVDSAGNVYVADEFNDTIRKVTPAGVVTTLAGLAGNSGSADGTGSAAQFFQPVGVAVDSAGNVYVADGANNTIRKITSAGVVTTLAGQAGSFGSADGTGTAAQFYNPSGVAVDGAGNVYVADYANHTIRKITSAGVVTTLAGLAGSPGNADGTGSAARFNIPSGVAVDSAGNLYVAEFGNSTIRKVTPAGVVTTVAGLAGSLGSADGTGSAARFYNPSGVAVDTNGSVYVADYGNHTIRKITSAGVVTTLAGLAGSPGSADGTGSAARFNVPTGVAVDSAGNVYVADSGNCTIRKVTPAGVVTTLAGLAGSVGSADGTGSAARFSNPSGVAVDTNGSVYVADYANHTIRKITSAGVVTTLVGVAGNSGSADGTGSAARFNGPTGVAVDSAGNLYVADEFNYTIRKVTPSGVVTTLAGLAGNSGSEDGTGTAARFSNPSGVAVDSAGNLYVGDKSNNTIRKITSAGVVTTVAGLAGSPGSADGTGSAARFFEPSGVAVDSAGNVYVADYLNNTIRNGFLVSTLNIQIDSVTNVVLTWSTGGIGFTLQSTRNLLPTAVWSTVVPTPVVVNGLNTVTNPITGTQQFYRLATPTAGAAWALYASSSGNNAIYKFNTNGVATLFATNGVNGVVLNNPQGVALDNLGNLYVANAGNGNIVKIDPQGNGTAFAHAAAGNAIYGVALDVSSNVFVADTVANNIQKITPGGVVSVFVGGPSSTNVDQPKGLAFDNAGNLFAANNLGGWIEKFDPQGNGIKFATVSQPLGLAFDAAGNLYTARANGQVLEYDAQGTGALFITISSALSGLAFDTAGNLYVAVIGNSTIEKVTPQGTKSVFATSSSGLIAPAFIAIQETR
jgi:sugar lactone lactonase YvrE